MWVQIDDNLLVKQEEVIAVQLKKETIDPVKQKYRYYWIVWLKCSGFFYSRNFESEKDAVLWMEHVLPEAVLFLGGKK